MSIILRQLYLLTRYISKNKGLKIHESFFSSNWEQILLFEDENIRFDSLDILKFAIMRSQDPIILTAGPFYVLNLPTFKAVSTNTEKKFQKYIFSFCFS